MDRGEIGMKTDSPDIVINRTELFALLEYSCSLPTGTTIGKRWRHNVHAYPDPRKPLVPPEKHEWKIGEFVEGSTKPQYVNIKWGWAVDENYEPHRGVKA